MTKITARIRRFLSSEDGPTAVEYALMVGVMVVAIATIAGTIGSRISGTFSTVSSSMGS